MKDYGIQDAGFGMRDVHGATQRFGFCQPAARITHLVSRIVQVYSIIFCILSFPAFASELTKGKKAMFSEDFELDVYEWRMEEKGEAEEELPRLIRTEHADEGNNALSLRGKHGILSLDLVQPIKGIVEFRVKFTRPFNYTRMFAVGLDDEQVMMGVNRSNKLSWYVGHEWRLTGIPVDTDWHTFTYDFSGAYARISIDGQRIAEIEKLREINLVRLGVNNEEGGDCLVDAFVIYSVEAGVSEEDALEVEIPFMGWDDGLKSCRDFSGSVLEFLGPEPAMMRVTDKVARTGKNSLEISFGPYEFSRWRDFHFYRRLPIPGLPKKFGCWIYGDGSGGEIAISFNTPNSGLKYKLPKITWTGWKKVEIDLTRASDSLYGREWALKEAAHEGATLTQIVLPPQPAGIKSHIYLDDMTVTTRLNKHAPYVLYVENTAEENIVDEGDPVEFVMRLGNFSQQKHQFTVDYQLQDYGGNTAFSGSVPVEAVAGDNTIARLSIDKVPNGWYLARFILTLDDRTITSVNEPIAVLASLDRELYSDENPLGNYSGPTRFIPRVGIAECYVNNPPTKAELAYLKKHNSTGIMFYQAPKWTSLPEETMHQAAEEWADEIAKTAASLKDEPIYYKVLTEPNNSGISPPRCYEVLKYAHKGLTKGNPNAKIIGLNTSKFDWGRQKVVWGLGGLKYVYAVGVHPYVGAHMGGRRPERVHAIGNLMSMLRLDDIIRRHNQGEPKKIWASEFGMTSSFTDANEGSVQVQADYTARMIMTFKTMDNFGKLHYHLPDDSSVWGKFGLLTSYGQPKPIAVAFHTLARRMTGVRWLKTLETKKNVRAYLYKDRHGAQMMAAWAIEGKDRLKVPLAVESVEIMDLMGATKTVEAKNRVLDIELTESPILINAPAGKRLIDRFIQVERRYRELRSGSTGITYDVRVANGGSEPLKGTLHCHPPEGIKVPKGKQDVEVAPGNVGTYSFNLALAHDCEAGLHDLWFSLDTGPGLDERFAKTYSMVSVVQPSVPLTAVRVKEAPVVDGRLDDGSWAQAKAVTQFLDDTTGFTPLVNQSVSLVYDKKGLYVGMTGKKRPGDMLRVDQKERDNGFLWQDECAEVFIDPNLDRDNYFQFIMTMAGVQADYKYVDTKKKKQDWAGARTWNGEWKAVAVQEDDGWSAEFFFPWETLEVEQGKVHRMGINVCRKYRPVGDPVIRSYTPGGIQVHGVESYTAVDVDLRF